MFLCYWIRRLANFLKFNFALEFGLIALFYGELLNSDFKDNEKEASLCDEIRFSQRLV